MTMKRRASMDRRDVCVCVYGAQHIKTAPNIHYAHANFNHSQCGTGSDHFILLQITTSVRLIRIAFAVSVCICTRECAKFNLKHLIRMGFHFKRTTAEQFVSFFLILVDERFSL